MKINDVKVEMGKPFCDAGAPVRLLNQVEQQWKQNSKRMFKQRIWEG